MDRNKDYTTPLWLIVILLFCILLTSCSPFMGYAHISDPTAVNDGSDLICAGAKIDTTLDISAAWCNNLRNDWAGVKIEIEYVWRNL